MEDIHKRIDMIPAALREGISKKQDRNYPPETTLLVYLNIASHGIRQQETEGAIRTALADQTGFSTILVLWQNRIY
jgi:hypothetical protein